MRLDKIIQTADRIVALRQYRTALKTWIAFIDHTGKQFIVMSLVTTRAPKPGNLEMPAPFLRKVLEDELRVVEATLTTIEEQSI